MAVPNTGATTAVKSTASFATDLFTYDQLVAGETISESHLIAASLGVLKRGTVLLGAAIETVMGTLTVTPGAGLIARAILAQDIDTGVGGAVTGLVYTQGKFLDTAMIFTANGAALDVAQLWDSGIYTLSVEQRSGLLVPIRSLPVIGGALPQMTETLADLQEDEKQLLAQEKQLQADMERLKQEAEAKKLQIQAEEKRLAEEKKHAAAGPAAPPTPPRHRP